MNFLRCPVCDKTPRCGVLGLVRHIAKKHQSVISWGHLTPWHGGPNAAAAPRRYLCWLCHAIWCKKPWPRPHHSPYFPSELDLWEHWREVGGLESHILEAKL